VGDARENRAADQKQSVSSSCLCHLPQLCPTDRLIRSMVRVVIVSGETGSGKTTQVPSFVLDDAILSNLGASTSIIVTQPRRVSAIGVATRVAAERLEDINDPNSRNLIGYAIRGERKADSKKCRMLFCTTGVVLARLGRGGDADLDDGWFFLVSRLSLD
jgi:HrpA-like RNA helicase